MPVRSSLLSSSNLNLVRVSQTETPVLLKKTCEQLGFPMTSVIYLHSEYMIMIDLELYNTRPAGVWLVTRPAGGGGGKGPPWYIPNYWTDFQISNAIR